MEMTRALNQDLWCILRRVALGTTLLAVGAAPAIGSAWDIPSNSSLVTCKASPISLHDLCEELSKQTGDTYVASGKAAEFNVALRVRALPVKRLRQAIAETMNLTWLEIEPEAGRKQWTFRLSQTAKDLAREQALQDAEEREYRKRVDCMLDALKEGDAGLKRLADSDDRFASTLTQPGSREALGVLGALSPDERQKMLDGGIIALNGLDESSGLGSAASKFMAAGRGALPGTSQENRHITRATISRHQGGLESFIGLGIGFTSGQNGSGSWSATLGISPGPDFRRWWDTDEMRESRSKPDPQVTLDAEVKAKTFDSWVVQIADKLDLNVVSASYAADGAYRLAPVAAPLSEVLDKLRYGETVWWKRGPVVMLQRERWWEAREHEVPDSLAQRLKALVKTGLYSLEDWSQLGVLTRKQWDWLSSVRELGQEHEWLPELSLFYALSPGDRTQLLAEGLSVARASGGTHDALLKWLAVRAPGDSTIPPEAVDLVIRAAVEKDATLFTVTAVARDGSTRVLTTQSVPLLPRAERSRRGLDKPKARSTTGR
jgi:hypothetical protein